jgi:hypothetical protein
MNARWRSTPYQAYYITPNDPVGQGAFAVNAQQGSGDGFGRSVVHALHTPAEDRRLGQGRDLHARRPDVDAIDGRKFPANSAA